MADRLSKGAKWRFCGGAGGRLLPHDFSSVPDFKSERPFFSSDIFRNCLTGAVYGGRPFHARLTLFQFFRSWEVGTVGHNFLVFLPVRNATAMENLE